MKLKSIISKTLVVGLLFNNGLTSLARVLSDDGRYETYEGTSITVDDILEEDKVDIEIEGNTLINLIESNSRNVQLKSKVYGTNSDGTTYSYFMNKANLKFPLKSSTEYTIAFKITDNPYDHIPISTIVLGQGDKNTGHGLDTWSNRLYWDKDFNMEEGEPGLGFYQATFTTSTRIEETSFLWIGFVGQAVGDFNTLIEDIVLVEGKFDLNNYFEGMKSVGELEDVIEIKVTNENIFNGVMEVGSINLEGDGSNIEDTTSNVYRSIYIEVKPNTTYSLSEERSVCFYDKDKRRIGNIYSNIITTPQSCFYIRLQQYGNEPITIAEGNIPTDKHYMSQAIKIELKEPLRALPNGVKDRIVKINGVWYIERNCKEIVLNGSSDEYWHPYIGGSKDNDNYLVFSWEENINPLGKQIWGTETLERGLCDKLKVIGDSLYFPENMIEGIAQGYLSNSNGNQWIIKVEKSKLNDLSANGFIEWLRNNPIKFIYEMITPIYEEIDCDSLQLYLETTHISNNSTIPANMKIIIDRTINRATEAIELVKTNPTTENLSKARMWVNLLDESIKKDELQNEINNIANLDDMVLERKSATANLDIYVMCENMLSMSLNTNNITFDNYSGVEDMEKTNALEISINSSLPYDLNAYLQTEIKGSENSNIMDMDILKIKDSSKDNYQSFANTTDKVILNEDCSSGNYISHNIDLKLESSNAYSVDVYKTTIKFEAVQK